MEPPFVESSQQAAHLGLPLPPGLFGSHSLLLAPPPLHPIMVRCLSRLLQLPHPRSLRLCLVRRGVRSPLHGRGACRGRASYSSDVDHCTGPSHLRWEAAARTSRGGAARH